MLYEEEFKDETFKEKAMKIHTEVSLGVSEHLKNQAAWRHRKTDDQCFLAKEAAKEALNVIDSLDICLEKSYFKAYLKQHAILWRLLEELELCVLIGERIAGQFGEYCFFIRPNLEHLSDAGKSN